MVKVDLFKLYGKYRGDFSIETNTLSKLDDKSIIDALEYNWALTLDRTNSKQGNIKCNVLYTKIKVFSSTRLRSEDEYEGFYSVTKDSTKYYTSFQALSKFLISKGWRPIFAIAGGNKNA